MGRSRKWNKTRLGVGGGEWDWVDLGWVNGSGWG